MGKAHPAAASSCRARANRHRGVPLLSPTVGVATLRPARCARPGAIIRSRLLMQWPTTPSSSPKCKAIPDWPKFSIERHVDLRRRAIDWSEHAGLEAAIDKYLACGNELSVIDAEEPDADAIDADDDADDDCIVPLSEEAFRSHKSSLTTVVWALRSTVPREQLVEPRDLCIPPRFRLAMRELKARAAPPLLDRPLLDPCVPGRSRPAWP